MTRFAALAAPLLALALLAGCSSDPPPAAEPPPAPARSLPEAQQAPDAPVVAGYTLAVPRLHIRSPLVSLGLNPDKTVQVPALDQPQQVGHYRGSPLPGAVGPSVLLAHISGRVDGRSVPGAFKRLDQLEVGDRIDVAVPDGLASRTVRFEVYKARVVPKAAFPTAEVYGDSVGPELRLVSCGGDYDAATHNYLDQVIVWARQAS